VDTMEILGVWRQWMEVQNAPSTVQGYYRSVWAFLLTVPGIPLVEVTERMIVEWLETFPHRSSARTTYMHGLKHLFTYMMRHPETGLEKDPTAYIRVLPPEEKEPEALTYAEYEMVRKAAYAHSDIRGYAVELLFHSGGRVGETVALTWDRVTTEGVVFAHTKSGKQRLAPWSPSLLRAVEGLREHFGEQERVLPRAKQTVWQWVSDAGKDCGLRAYPHLLRGTAITIAQERGVMQGAVQKWAGHSKPSTTSRYYTKVRHEQLQKVAMALEGA